MLADLKKVNFRNEQLLPYSLRKVEIVKIVCSLIYSTCTVLLNSLQLFTLAFKNSLDSILPKQR